MRLIDADALKERAIRVSTVKEHCYMKAVGTHEIDKAPTVATDNNVGSKWIPVTERLPENEKIIAVFGNPIEVWTFNGEYWQDEYGWLQEFKDITYWLPLPGTEGLE